MLAETVVKLQDLKFTNINQLINSFRVIPVQSSVI